jgi:hypothetical protein
MTASIERLLLGQSSFIAEHQRDATQRLLTVTPQSCRLDAQHTTVSWRGRGQRRCSGETDAAGQTLARRERRQTASLPPPAFQLGCRSL